MVQVGGGPQRRGWQGCERFLNLSQGLLQLPGFLQLLSLAVQRQSLGFAAASLLDSARAYGGATATEVPGR